MMKSDDPIVELSATSQLTLSDNPAAFCLCNAGSSTSGRVVLQLSQDTLPLMHAASALHIYERESTTMPMQPGQAKSKILPVGL